MDHQRIERMAAQALQLWMSGRQIPTFTETEPGFDLAEAYACVARQRALREARGERAVGRKIGFTNRAIWRGYGISGPIWHFMFDNTVRDIAKLDGPFPLAGMAEARIEPEIVLHLARAPSPGMSDAELFACLDWVSHGFEVVHSPFPGWRFAAADAAAAWGVHGALLLGPRHDVRGDPGFWQRALREFTITLTSGDGVSVAGGGANVLGGPVQALRFLVEEIARHPGTAPLEAGEVITTGTLTEALPAVAGERWETRLDGIPLEGLRLAFG